MLLLLSVFVSADAMYFGDENRKPPVRPEMEGSHAGNKGRRPQVGSVSVSPPGCTSRGRDGWRGGGA